nr:pre-mRNA splicing Prp18-interacting factor [Tanacetum cinerariifolium]
MSTFVLCVGCETPLYGFSPCQWCTCELCGNDLRDGFCALCNSRNSCVYDPNPNSFDCPPDSCHPPHPTYETYSCDSYGIDYHFGYDCQPQFPLNYESEPGYIENYNSYPYVSSSFPQQELCCENSGEEKRIEEEQAANARYWKIPACCDDDDDYDSAITPNKPVDSLSMGDEHLNTIPEKESNEFIKSSVENFVPNLSEFEDECECDVPDCDDSQTKKFSTFSNPLFDDSTAGDDESSHEEVTHEMTFKTYSNPLFDLDEEIISNESNPIHNEVLDSTPKNDRFDTDSYLLESSLNRDTLMISSLKIDYLLAEFAGELTFLESIPPRIDEANCDLEEDIHLAKRFNSRMEEIDLTLTPNDPMQPSIEEDDDDSERDILINEELLDNYSLSLPVNESFHFDIPSFSRPPAKPRDVVQYSRKLEDSCQRILSSTSSFPQLQLGIILLHLAGSQPMLKSSYKAEDGVIISIPPLVGGVADVVVEIKGTGVYYDYSNK